MAPQQLIDACEGRDVVTLVLPWRETRGEFVRLCGRSGPRGELLCDNGKRLVVRFNAKTVAAWATKKIAAGNL